MENIDQTRFCKDRGEWHYFSDDDFSPDPWCYSEVPGGGQRSFLMHAAEEGRVKEAARLLADGSKVNYVDKKGWSAFMYAATHGSVKMGELLLDSGADMFHVSDYEEGATAFHIAMRSCNLKFAKLMLSRGFNVDAVDAWGNSALIDFMGFRPFNLDEVAFLLKNGANVNFVGNFGATARSRCRTRSMLDLIEKHGAA